MPRNPAIDATKLILAAFVVLLHLNLFRWIDPALFAVTNNAIFRTAVPLFFVFSGYFLAAVPACRRSEWVLRLAKVYLLWTVIYLPLWVFHDLPAWRWLLVLGFGYHHLWYLPGLIFAGLVLLALAYRGWRVADLLTLALGLYLVGWLIQMARLAGLADLSPALAPLGLYESYRNGLFFGFPFVTLGYVVGTRHIPPVLNILRLKLILAAGCVLLVTEALIYQRLFGTQHVDMLLSLAIVCPALAVLLFRTPVQAPDLRSLAQLAMGIYLVHPWVIYLVKTQITVSFSALVSITMLLTGLASYALLGVNRRVRVL